MQNVITIAKKEYRDSLRNKLFLILLAFLFVLTVTSIAVASSDFQSKVVEYNKSVQILFSLGKSGETISAPQFFPLKMLRGVMDYLEIIGAIIGIILGYLSIAKEKGKNTLQLLLSRPLRKFDIASGKFLGNSLLVLSVLAVEAFTTYFIMWSVGGAQLSLVEIVKLGFVLFASYFYIMFFFCFTSVLVLKFRSLPNALIISFVVWLIFVLIIPQIGDTMDPDNQIPGGFFKSMSIAKPQEKEIMARFKTYENVRNAVEESSVTKHYERLSFALLGIKDEYNGKSVGYVLKDRWNDWIWVMAFFTVALFLEYFSFKKRSFLNKAD